MCNTPIIIANRSRRYTETISKRMFKVPCGHCHECHKRMQDDWFVRSFFEYRRVSANGSCWFFTLTYRDDKLPVYRDPDYVDPDTGECCEFARPCFSNSHLKKFRDRLRVYLGRAGYDIKNIRFFITCELGGKYGRPHYHPLLFLPFRIPFKKLWNILNKAWTLGRVGFSKTHGMLVTSARAVEYCCKYVSKESAWFRLFGLSDYYRFLYTQYKQGFDVEEKFKEFRRSYRLHFQSMHFGIDGVSVLCDGCKLSEYGEKSFHLGTMDLVHFGYVDKDLRHALYAIPSYYSRKVLYVKDDFGLDRKNDIYTCIAKERFSDIVAAFERVLSVYFDEQSFRDHIAPLDYTPDEVVSMFKRLHSCHVSCTPYIMGVYAAVYSDLLLASKDGNSWPHPILGVSPICLRYSLSPKAALDLLVKKAPEMYAYSHVYERDIPDPKNQSRYDTDISHFRDMSLPHYSDLSCFHGFDAFVNLVADYESQLGRLRSDSKFSEDDKEYQTALLTNVLNTKYSFIYSKIYEIL